MILPFSTQLNGKPTRFVEKIVFGLYKKGIISLDKASELLDTPMSFIKIFETEKLHTVREDLKERWRPGINIHFFINVRQPNMFRFAPVLPVVSTQKIEFIWKDNTENLTCLGTSFDKTCTIMIDDRFYGDAYFFNGSVVSSSYTILIFANNEGFDTREELFAYFNKNFKGKIIHWTDLKY